MYRDFKKNEVNVLPLLKYLAGLPIYPVKEPSGPMLSVFSHKCLSDITYYSPSYQLCFSHTGFHAVHSTQKHLRVFALALPLSGILLLRLPVSLTSSFPLVCS